MRKLTASKALVFTLFCFFFISSGASEINKSTYDRKVANLGFDKALLLPYNGLFRQSLLECTESTNYSIYDVQGIVVDKGVVKPDSRCVVSIKNKLGPGYYEVEAGGRRKGYIVYKPGRIEQRFSLDSAITVLTPKDDRQSRLSYINIISRLGFSSVRDRFRWSESGVGNNPDLYDTLWVRKQYKSRNISVLDVIESPPKGVGDFPLPSMVSEDIPFILKVMTPYWNAVEPWNEPNHNPVICNADNLKFGHYVDSYLKYSAIFNQLVSPSGIKVVTGAFAGGASVNKKFSSAISSKVSRDGTYFSFHDHKGVFDFISTFNDVARWVGGRMPLIVSESGFPFSENEGNYSSAVQISMKAVLAKYYSVYSYFAFVLPYYKERGKLWGMTDQDGYPLPSLAMYQAVARNLTENTPVKNSLVKRGGRVSLLFKNNHDGHLSCFLYSDSGQFQSLVDNPGVSHLYLPDGREIFGKRTVRGPDMRIIEFKQGQDSDADRLCKSF